MLHVPTTPIPESTGIPEWSLTDEHHHHAHHHHSQHQPQQSPSPPQSPHHHDNDYFHSTEDNFFFLHQQDHEHDPQSPPPSSQQQQQQQQIILSPNDHDVALPLPPPPPLSPQFQSHTTQQPPPPQLPPPLLEPGLGEEDIMEDHHHHYLHDNNNNLLPPHGDYHVGMDATYETATRIFYATMEKFTKQGYHRRSFLESWHLHSMYSKSQQILLGIPNAQSMVFLSGDDFMFTPQLVPQEMEFDWEEQQPLSMADEGVMVMTAPAPEMMDENTWMRQQHHGLLEEEEEDEEEVEGMPIHHHHHHGLDDMDHEENNHSIGPVTPDLHHHHHQMDLVNWYRAGNNHPPPAPPSTIMGHDDEHDDMDDMEDSHDHDIHPSPLQQHIERNSIVEHEIVQAKVVDDDDDGDDHVSNNDEEQQQQQQQQPENEEEEDDEDQTVEEQPSSPKGLCNNNATTQSNGGTQGEKGKEIIRINAEEYISSIEKDLSIHDVEECNVLSYQSLADMIPPPPLIPPLPSSTTTATTHLPLASNTTTVGTGSYGSTMAERSLLHHPQQRSIQSTPRVIQQNKKKDLTEKLLQFPFLRSSDRLTNAILEAFELAEELANNKVTLFGFLLYFFRIWQVLFFCAESLISIRRSPPLVPPYYRKHVLRSTSMTSESSSMGGDSKFATSSSLDDMV
ncbi:hypothetical protein BDA99DRAFT_537685 [Phascolomyces articulosus]|uniref:Uncharacterized protein n=1 Tax=Phascolomyces articulosus TaxID=60185 RepID=A0AAD5PE18_9FUNG|nr:hypothetical protein BDA99DRAFT_537685 [Phascolomyces articulosus]